MGDTLLTATLSLLPPGRQRHRRAAWLHPAPATTARRWAQDRATLPLTRPTLRPTGESPAASSRGMRNTSDLRATCTQTNAEQPAWLPAQPRAQLRHPRAQLRHPRVPSSLRLLTSRSDAYSKGNETEPLCS